MIWFERLQSKLNPWRWRFYTTENSSYMDISRRFSEAMKTCANNGNITEARTIHAHLVTMGLCLSSTFLQNHLMTTYSNLGCINDSLLVFQRIVSPNVFSRNTLITGLCNGGWLDDARKLFDEMVLRDCVSWNAMMSGYIQKGLFRDALILFSSMMANDSLCRPNQFSMSAALKACGGIGDGQLSKQLYCSSVKLCFLIDPHVGISILDMFIKCGKMNLAAGHFSQMKTPDLLCWNAMIIGYSKSGRGVEQAVKVFDEMPERDIVSWNTILSILSQHGHGKRTLPMLLQMDSHGFEPDSVTYTTILSALAASSELNWGRHLHARILKRLTDTLDVYIGSALIDMYAKHKCLRIAKRVFDGLPCQNTVSWTSIIAGSSQLGFITESFSLFNQMRRDGVELDQFTLATVLATCEDLRHLTTLHCLSMKLSLDFYIPVSNALLTSYAKHGSITTAGYIFDSMTDRDVISWTSMVTLYSQAGDISSAVSYFNKTPERNLVTWNSMLAGHIQLGYQEDGIKLFISMHRDGKVKPDWVTFVTLLSACADSGSLQLGEQIIPLSTKTGFESDTSVRNGIVTMYSKCGKVGEADLAFMSIVNKDLVSWNSIISGYAQNGLGSKALEVFETMLSEHRPDHITFIAVLSGCSYAGLVEEGRFYFNSMNRVHNISPNIEHFACMVDLLGRAGQLDEAKELIAEMPFPPSAAVWGALLSASRIHGQTETAEHAIRNLLRTNSDDSGSYTLLANIHSYCGNSDCVAEIRKTMRERGIRKIPGCSWIEMRNRVHVFTSHDMNHDRTDTILEILDHIAIFSKVSELDQIVISENDWW